MDKKEAISKGLDRISKVLSSFEAKDYQVFHDTIETLCSKGVGKGTYQDYAVLVSVLEILTTCEAVIENFKENN